MKNRIYVGLIVHKDEAYPGEHAAIVDAQLFEAVQKRITDASITRREAQNKPLSSLLTGLVKDRLGRRMTPSHSRKGAKRYRYYITGADQLQPGGPPTCRFPASDLETLVIAQLQQFLADRDSLRKLLPGAAPSVAELMEALEKAKEVSAVLGTTKGRATLLRKLVREVQVQEASVALTLDRSTLLKRLDIVAKVGRLSPLIITASAVRIRRGQDVALVPTDPKGSAQRADAKLLTLLEQAQATRKSIDQHPEWSMHRAAVTLKQNRERLIQLVRLSFLSPEIVGAIHEGRHPATLTPRALLAAELPMHWDQQKVALGFG